ncbi:hypothetical protein PR003_g29986 [Phytophthora rubi]|uniref:Uncharacterized protein n=1 Tax=Phytophthora rubi TaxID=129364 RepID=A0A6A4BKQ4_9STRA|nr:hypothetical protein PR003_g29986 [Phytophthora rubi]
MPRRQKRCSPPDAATEAKRRRMPSRSANTTKMSTPREDSVLFKKKWRSLHRNGWTSKPPALRSLDTSYRYVKPGCNPDGDEGTDFFRGEQALVAYYQKQGGQLIQTDGEMVRVLPGNDLSILSRSSLAPSVGEQERKNAGNGDVIIDKQSDEGDTAVGQPSSGVFDAEKAADLHSDCASSCSADEERDGGFPRCRTETSAPVGGSVGRDYNSGGSCGNGQHPGLGSSTIDAEVVAETCSTGTGNVYDHVQENAEHSIGGGLGRGKRSSGEVVVDVAFEAVWEAVECVEKGESVEVPEGVTFEAVVELFSIRVPMIRVPMIRVPMVLALMIRVIRTSVMVLAVAEVTFEAVRYGTEYVESVEGVGDVEAVAVGEPFPMRAQMIQMVTD